MATAAPEDTRAARRTNTLIAADVLVGDKRWSVKVRNMSALGAMVETPVKIDLGSSVLLKRGSLHASGEVVWRREGTLGLRFFERLAVEDWLGMPTRDAVGNLEVTSPTRATAEEFDDLLMATRVVEEIDYVARVASAVAENLALDPILRVRHCSRIQELSMAAEMLEQLSTVLLSADKVSAVEANVTGPMKHRMLR